MSFTVTYNSEKDCIKVVVRGEVNLPLLQSMASEVSKIAKQEGCQCILNDLREAKAVEKAFDIYEMPDAASEAGVHVRSRRALVVGNRAYEFKFLETVFMNKGHMVKMFENMDDAVDWLTTN